MKKENELTDFSKITNYIIGVAVVLYIMFGIVVFIGFGIESPSIVDYIMFDDINDFTVIFDNNDIETSNIVDNNLQNLEYIDKIAVSFQFNGRNFQLFAYVFICEQTVQQYINNVFGSDISRFGSFYARQTIDFVRPSRFLLAENNKLWLLKGPNIWPQYYMVRLILRELEIISQS